MKEKLQFCHAFYACASTRVANLIWSFFLCELTCMAPKQNFLSCTVFSQVCQGITLVYPPVDMRNVYIALLHPTATETKRAERH